MKNKKSYDDYYDIYRGDIDKTHGNDLPKIRTDFKLFFELIKEILLWAIMLIPYLLGVIISLILVNKDSTRRYLEKIVFEPFEIIKKIVDWFFEAKITSFLILVLIFIYGLEVFYLGPYMQNFMSYPLHIFEGNYWSLFSSVFLHADLVHLLTNCLALLIFGRIVEMHLGVKMFPLFIACGLISGFISNMIAYYTGDIYYSLGASGAIAGIIMFAILFSPFSLTSVLIVPLPVFAVGWFLIFLDLAGLTAPSQTNHLAHLCGYGALLVLFFFLELRHRKKIIAGLTLNVLLLIMFFVLMKIFNLEIYL